MDDFFYLFAEKSRLFSDHSAGECNKKEIPHYRIRLLEHSNLTNVFKALVVTLPGWVTVLLQIPFQSKSPSTAIYDPVFLTYHTDKTFPIGGLLSLFRVI